MAQKALYFDASRCSACQACVVACRRRFSVELVGLGDNAPFGRAGAVDDEAPLAVALSERQTSQAGLVWEAHRFGCVHCLEAPCVEVCPTEALQRNDETGFVFLDQSRCVGCHLCTLVCPADAPRHGVSAADVLLCDGCSDAVANGESTACVQACPFDALAVDDRNAIVEKAQARASALRDSGYEEACVLGLEEQGGHGVIQVLKYGIAGGPHEALASTGSVDWLDAASMAGPASVGVMGAAALAGVAGLAFESRKTRLAAEAAAASAQAATEAAINPLWVQNAPTVPEEASSVVGESPLQAALRRRESLRLKKGSTPAAAAAAAASTAEGDFLWSASFDAGTALPFRMVNLGRDCYGMKDYPGIQAISYDNASAYTEEPVFGEQAGWGFASSALNGFTPFNSYDEDALDVWDTADAPDDYEGLGGYEAAWATDAATTGEIPIIDIDDVGDTGELYDQELFNRLLAEDAARKVLTSKDGEGFVSVEGFRADPDESPASLSDENSPEERSPDASDGTGV